jgi:ABC-type sulfate transport system permease component
MVASVFIFNVIQDGDSGAASAVAIVLLGAAFVVLLAIGALRFYFTRHERA